MFPRVPLAAPYWSGATYRAVVRSIFCGAVIDGPDLHALKNSLINHLGVAEALLCGSGSLALEIALRVCGVRRGDEVVIPTFCCSAVVLPLVAVGAVPVLADVGAELNLTAETVIPVLTRKTRAIIVPHLFGNSAEIGAIVELARDRDIRVVDDAAQALGATVDGRPVGTFGDLGVLSFGAEKVCFGLGGGVLVSRNKDFLNDDAKFNLQAPPLSRSLRNFLSTLVWRRWRRWTFPLHEFISRKESRDPEAPPILYPNERLANLNAAVALTLIQSLRENIEARHARVRAYRELLGDQEGLDLIRHRPASACLTQVVSVAKNRRKEDRASTVTEALRKAGYEIQGSYVPMHRLPHCSMCVWDNLPYTDKVWTDLIELPCEPDVSLHQLEQIAAIVKRVVTS